MRTVHSNSIMTTTDENKRVKSFVLFLDAISNCKDTPIMEDLKTMLKARLRK